MRMFFAKVKHKMLRSNIGSKIAANGDVNLLTESSERDKMDSRLKILEQTWVNPGDLRL